MVRRSGPAGAIEPFALLVIAAMFALLTATAQATDEPVVMVYADRLVPERLEVHLGELVTWRAVDGRRLRLELDPHPSGHEVVTRSGEVRAYFRKPGKHWYAVTLPGRAGKVLRGEVSVRQGQPREAPFPTCSPESSDRICLQP